VRSVDVSGVVRTFTYNEQEQILTETIAGLGTKRRFLMELQVLKPYSPSSSMHLKNSRSKTKLKLPRSTSATI
jgi:YD repeat-containing protein